jgi:hypothetical protein
MTDENAYDNGFVVGFNEGYAEGREDEKKRIYKKMKAVKKPNALDWLELLESLQCNQLEKAVKKTFKTSFESAFRLLSKTSRDKQPPLRIKPSEKPDKELRS